MNKEVILTGIRPNNFLHIGNYLGALLPMVDMAKNKASEYQVNMMVADLHSFTTPVDHSKLQDRILQTLRIFAAAGLPLDHEGIFLYRQSYIPAHSELTWIFDCFTGFGEFSRMLEFKDKSARFGSEHIGVGQFNYPALMATDILLYGAVYIPVGDDQRQHIEYTRLIAERFNKRFGPLFVVPKSMAEMHDFFGKDQGLRIRDLQNPSKKMSKSDESGRGVIFLTDPPDTARQKIMSAETDSLADIQYDFEKQPGISNLLDIYALLGGNKDSFIGQKQYGALKSAVADEIEKFLRDFQTKLSSVDDAAIHKKLEADEASMSSVANQTLARVQQAVGLRPKL